MGFQALARKGSRAYRVQGLKGPNFGKHSRNPKTLLRHPNPAVSSVDLRSRLKDLVGSYICILYIHIYIYMCYFRACGVSGACSSCREL